MIFGKHINRYYLKYAPMLLLGVLALLAVDYFQLEIPELYRMVINGVNDGRVVLGGEIYDFDLDFLLDRICLPMIFTILALVIGRFAWRICFFGAGIRVESDVRLRMFSHCKDLSRQYYHENKVGTMMSLFTNDLETVQECFSWGVMMLFDATALGALALYKMFRLHTVLSLFTMLPILLLFLVGLIVRRYMMLKWEKRQEAFSTLSDFSQENFSGLAVVKAFVKEGRELLAFRRLNRENEDANVAYTKLSTLLHVLVTLLVESVICIILGYGGYLVYTGVFDAGMLIEFIGYFTAIVWPVMAVSEMIEMSSRGKASLRRISELLDAVPDVVDAKDVAEPLAPLSGKIEFRGLTFRYPGTERAVLSDVSFTVEAGERVGIIGKTGSGKTSIVDLILRSYNVPDGTLFLDGNDVNRIPIRTVRRYAAYVPQDNFLFSDTIRNNIAFASDTDDPALVREAATLADVHENIAEFPDGYETLLGERGVTVSGGQKQRISIARALLKDAPILILDDSVSAVDTKTERQILKNLAALRRGKTTILIAHRISTVEEMDKLILVEDGRVTAVGRHEELYESCPSYRTMVELQMLEEKGGEVNA
ncbi:MAG: ABC transporter ATP-binding protein [Clostridia bacterium]|nr:ABC transporter ATP-binding protein [Clostridia bacterium]